MFCKLSPDKKCLRLSINFFKIKIFKKYNNRKIKSSRKTKIYISASGVCTVTEKLTPINNLKIKHSFINLHTFLLLNRMKNLNEFTSISFVNNKEFQNQFKIRFIEDYFYNIFFEATKYRSM